MYGNDNNINTSKVSHIESSIVSEQSNSSTEYIEEYLDIMDKIRNLIYMHIQIKIKYTQKNEDSTRKWILCSANS